MEPLRLSNASYTVTRLVGLVCMSAVTAGVAWVVFGHRTEADIVAVSLTTVGLLFAWSLYGAASAAWYVEIREDAVIVRRMFGRSAWSWSQVDAVRAVDLVTAPGSHYLGRHLAVSFERRGAPRVTVVTDAGTIAKVAERVAGKTRWIDNRSAKLPEPPTTPAGKLGWFVLDLLRFVGRFFLLP